MSVAFSTGAVSGLAKGAIIQDVAALHFTMAHGMRASVSTQIAALRRILLEPGNGELGHWSRKVTWVSKSSLLISARVHYLILTRSVGHNSSRRQCPQR